MPATGGRALRLTNVKVAGGPGSKFFICNTLSGIYPAGKTMSHLPSRSTDFETQYYNLILGGITYFPKLLKRNENTKEFCQNSTSFHTRRHNVFFETSEKMRKHQRISFQIQFYPILLQENLRCRLRSWPRWPRRSAASSRVTRGRSNK